MVDKYIAALHAALREIPSDRENPDDIMALTAIEAELEALRGEREPELRKCAKCGFWTRLWATWWHTSGRCKELRRGY